LGRFFRVLPCERDRRSRERTACIFATRRRLDRGSGVFFGLLTLLFAYLTAGYWHRFPIRLELTERGPKFTYRSQKSGELTWSGPSPTVYLHNIRVRKRFQDVPYNGETWVAWKYGGVLAPLTEEVFDTFLETARKCEARVEEYQEPFLVAFSDKWGWIGTIYRIRPPS
jgi:hypothetical protein